MVEAKDNTHPVGGGLQQGISYAEALDVPFVFSSNGDAFMFHDRTGLAASVERQIGLDEFPSPDDLSQRYRALERTRRSIGQARPLTLLRGPLFPAQAPLANPRQYVPFPGSQQA